MGDPEMPTTTDHPAVALVCGQAPDEASPAESPMRVDGTLVTSVRMSRAHAQEIGIMDDHTLHNDHAPHNDATLWRMIRAEGARLDQIDRSAISGGADYDWLIDIIIRMMRTRIMHAARPAERVVTPELLADTGDPTLAHIMARAAIGRWVLHQLEQHPDQLAFLEFPVNVGSDHVATVRIEMGGGLTASEIIAGERQRADAVCIAAGLDRAEAKAAARATEANDLRFACWALASRLDAGEDPKTIAEGIRQACRTAAAAPKGPA